MKNLSASKIQLFLFLSISSFQALAQENCAIEVTILSTEILKDDAYLTENPEHKRDGLIEVQAKIRNNSEVDLDLNNILLEGYGEERKPLVILRGKDERIKPNKSKKRKIIYSFPKSMQPANLLVGNSCRIPIRSQNAWESIIYFDANWDKIPSKDNAVYYRRISRSGNQWIVRDYFISNDQIQMESEYSSLDPEIKNGHSIWYHENGSISQKGAFKDNKRTGIFFKYYDTGRQKSKTEYGAEKQKLLQYWSESGDALLTSGTGTIHKLHKENSIITDYEDYSVVQSMEIRKLQADTVYSYIETAPVYPGGFEELYQFLNQHIVYPVEARKNGTEGRVYIRFLVDKSGNPVEVETIKGIGSGCDKESERIMELAGGWNPGKVDGKPVKFRYILPITFRLD